MTSPAPPPQDGPAVEDAPPAAVRRPAYRVLVPLTALGAGLLFALSASTAQGTDLRAERREVADLITQEQRDVEELERTAAALRARVAAKAAGAAAGDSRVRREQQRADRLAPAAGLTPVRGPGLRVSLDDAPRPEGGTPASDNPDDLVVHQQDLQAVVNALWAGGAEAMTLMGQRIVSTSAVRCVGNTVVLHGQVYGPPFVVEAVGDQDDLRAALEGSSGVQLFRTFVERFGLGYEVQAVAELDLPAYDRTVDLPSVVRR